MIEHLWRDPAAASDPGAADAAAGADAGRPAHRPGRSARRAAERAALYLVPSAHTAAKGESAALEVLAQLMGGGSNSYLYRALVIDRPLAISVGAHFGHGARREPVRRRGDAEAGVEFSEIEKAVDNVIADIVRNPIRSEDLSG